MVLLASLNRLVLKSTLRLVSIFSIVSLAEALTSNSLSATFLITSSLTSPPALVIKTSLKVLLALVVGLKRLAMVLIPNNPPPPEASSTSPLIALRRSCMSLTSDRVLGSTFVECRMYTRLPSSGALMCRAFTAEFAVSVPHPVKINKMGSKLIRMNFLTSFFITLYNTPPQLISYFYLRA